MGRVVSEEKRTQTTTGQTYKFTKLEYFATLTCSHGGVKVKIKCTLHIYTVPSVDWYHQLRVGVHDTKPNDLDLIFQCHPVAKLPLVSLSSVL